MGIPDNFAEVDEDGKPYCFSTFNIKDEEENDVAIVLKSYKNDKAPFSINPEEWDYLTVSKAKLVIYRGNGHHEELEKEDLIRNQNCVKLRFSTENLDIEDRISQFSDIFTTSSRFILILKVLIFQSVQNLSLESLTKIKENRLVVVTMTSKKIRK